MSWGALAWVVGAPKQNMPALSGPSGANRMVLLMLAYHANDEDAVAWPSMQRIQDETNLSAKTVKVAIRWLVEHEYITRDIQGSPIEFAIKPQYRTNAFRLCFDAEVKEPTNAPSDSRGGKIGHSRGGNPGLLEAPTPTYITTQEQQPEIGVKTTSTKEPLITSRSSATDVDESFAVFWSLYPLKTSKHDARIIWKSAKKMSDADRAAAIAALPAYVSFWKSKPGPREFIPNVPYPTTWLNGRRWETPPPVVGQQTGKYERGEMYDDGSGNWVPYPENEYRS